jgi:hypothetical protein
MEAYQVALLEIGECDPVLTNTLRVFVCLLILLNPDYNLIDDFAECLQVELLCGSETSYENTIPYRAR